ncbi:hypothetical protein [Amycolatopsis anabasis]|uniref:hypothetical protein n=1 Tax=Amycolatopsis anabasis TaxID=1840409 RepID=UPI003CCCA089
MSNHLAEDDTLLLGPPAGGTVLDPGDHAVPADATAYVCGPLPFMREVRAGLLRRGMPTERIRYEMFGPGMLDNRDFVTATG